MNPVPGALLQDWEGTKQTHLLTPSSWRRLVEAQWTGCCYTWSSHMEFHHRIKLLGVTFQGLWDQDSCPATSLQLPGTGPHGLPHYRASSSQGGSCIVISTTPDTWPLPPHRPLSSSWSHSSLPTTWEQGSQNPGARVPGSRVSVSSASPLKQLSPN